MTPAQINRMRSEWEDFRGGDYRRDHERAQFFRRWRRRYATGNATRRAAGDIQFSDDVNAHLPDIKGQTALNYCRLLTLFRSERTWVNLGGYHTMLHLANMPTTAARNRVKTAALAKAVGIEVQTVAFFLFHGLKNDLELGRPRTVSIETLRNLQAEFAEKFPPHHDEFPRLTSYEQVQGILAEVMAERDLFRVLRFAWRFVCQVESYRHRVKGERSCCHRDLIAMDAFLKAAFVEYTARGMTHWDPPPHLAPVIREAADAGLFGESDSE